MASAIERLVAVRVWIVQEIIWFSMVEGDLGTPSFRIWRKGELQTELRQTWSRSHEMRMTLWDIEWIEYIVSRAAGRP